MSFDLEALFRQQKRTLLQQVIAARGKDELLKSSILLIYNASRSRVFQAVDVVGRGIISPSENVTILDKADEPVLPVKEEWDFQLGDAVKVSVSREDFKWMQRNTLGWREDLQEIYGLVGIVTKVNSRFENAIGVYFPKVYAAVSLYAGLLEKTEPEEDPNMSCRWKRGDYVTTLQFAEVLQLLQIGLDRLSHDFLGKRGRVVGVAHPCVMVTFDEKTTKDLKGSSLVTCNDTSPITGTEVKHDRGFKVGDQVRIISNMKKLIENQKEKGGWSSDMCPIRGQTATVTAIFEDGALGVQIKNSRPWRLSPDSVLRHKEKETRTEEDLTMMPGEIVKVVAPRHLQGALALAGVPASFFEYLRSTAVLSHVGEDIDYYIRFNQDQNIQAHADAYRKATPLEKEEHDRIATSEKNIEKGSRVHLDIGPPNYVQAVLAELDIDPSIKMALTKSAVVVGYINPYSVVIEYEDGSRFKVKKKLLTVPEKFYFDKSRDTVQLKVVQAIEDKITTSVEDIHRTKNAATDRWKVEVVFMCHGNPPYIEFRISSAVATAESIFEWLEQNSGWKLEFPSHGQFVIRGHDAPNMEVKVGIIFGNEDSEFVPDLGQGERKRQIMTGSQEEDIAPANDADREGPSKPPEEQPEVLNFEQYIRLCNQAFARNVFFPNVISGDHRTPVQPLAGDDGSHTGAGVTNHIKNEGQLNFHLHQH